MPLDIQPTLENDLVRIVPLEETDFDAQYAFASDPLLWEQHPSYDRYKCEVFEEFFRAAMESKGAFKVIDKKTGTVMGGTRYYDIDAVPGTIAIGYSFIDRAYWGTQYNRSIKTLLLVHAFTVYDTVIFHVGATNMRSQKAMEKLGAVKVGEYYPNDPGAPRLHVIYHITKAAWNTRPR